VAAFALAGAVVLLLVGVAGVIVLRRIGTAEAMREAENVAAVAARVVQRRISDGLIRGDVDSLLPIDALVNAGVLKEPIVRVKIRNQNGKVLYSDETSLIGKRFELDGPELEALSRRGVTVVESDPQAPGNQFEQDLGPLLEVSVPVETPKGRLLLFQAYLRFDSIAASGQRLWVAFLPVLAIALVALALLQIPLAYRLGRQIQSSQQDRERLMQRAIESSDVERRRIAADLHDGLVQQLAGLSMSLSAQADRFGSDDPAAAEALRDAAGKTRRHVRLLRSALMGIYPPTMERAGLSAALSDLATPLNEGGVRTTVDIPDGLDLPKEVELLMFRVSQEALRNITQHSQAQSAHVSVSTGDGMAALEVSDDGVGFSEEQAAAAQADGHFGLKLLGDLAKDADGNLEVNSTPGEGTMIRLEVPLR
jgi:signal transduction histidine kinase